MEKFKELPFETIRELRGLGFIHITGLKFRHPKYSDDPSQSHRVFVIAATKDVWGFYFHDTIVTEDGQVWIRKEKSADSNTSTEETHAIEELKKQLCPKGEFAKKHPHQREEWHGPQYWDVGIDFDGSDNVYAMDLYHRVSHPYK